MVVLVVDSDRESLFETISYIRRRYKKGEIVAFENSRDALKYGFQNRVDMLFVNARLEDMDAFALYEKLTNYNIGMRTVVLSEYKEDMFRAYEEHVYDFIHKPIRDLAYS